MYFKSAFDITGKSNFFNVMIKFFLLQAKYHQLIVSVITTEPSVVIGM